ncbi:hypothetical protein DL766_003670 [Monosporascus sp. MC13-8B]|uniref:Uncharacterized protein n=1 Tax=Monosporascus cannonballus TaxID=155416 RepID=A0ABY0H7M1_9PEZI|nr:hypothetical protein DL762_005985 [Monosporascus cannonballus]RYO93643.1 hypothetical protein DL763_004318 [Monosporascus cannonballus]RYP33077.1 hypothetical protein DL766_003670 [Monosporascus sp. MC13-8B]
MRTLIPTYCTINAQFPDLLSIKVLESNNSSWVFDFGVEIGGAIHVNYTLSGSPAVLGLAFTDSKIWIGQRSDNSNGVTDLDFTLYRKIDAHWSGRLRCAGQQTARQLSLTHPLPREFYFKLNIVGVELVISFQPTCIIVTYCRVATFTELCEPSILANLTISHKRLGAEYPSRAADPIKVSKAHLWDSEKGALTDTPTHRLICPSRRQQHGHNIRRPRSQERRGRLHPEIPYRRLESHQP